MNHILITIFAILNVNLIFCEFNAEKWDIPQEIHFKKGGSPAYLWHINKIVGKCTSQLISKSGDEIDFEIEKLIHEAQNTYDIPAEQRLRHYNTSDVGGICVAPDALYINPKSLENSTYGDKRFKIFHAIAHAQDCDQTQEIIHLPALLKTKEMLPLLFVASAFATVFVDNEFKKVLFCSAFASGSFFILIRQLYETNKEAWRMQRENNADRQAALASQCSQCIREFYSGINVLTESERKEFAKKDNETGYLSMDELESIAKMHERNDSLCEYHREIEIRQQKKQIKEEQSKHFMNILLSTIS